MRASISLHFSSVEGAALRFLSHRRSSFDQSSNPILGGKKEFVVLNTSGNATCDESFVENNSFYEKSNHIGSTLCTLGLMLVSCSTSEPEATTTTTRQTTVTTAAPPPTTGARTTTTTTHTGGY